MSPYHMRAEIAEQSALLRGLAPSWERACERLAVAIAAHRQVTVIGRGSSGNAALFFAYLYGLRTGRQVVDFRPWLATQGVPAADWSDTLALAFSVSGESTDVAHAARWLRDRGAHVIGVTNRAEDRSELGCSVHVLLRFDIGAERAVPATKTLTAQLFVAAGLCGLPIVNAAHEAADAIDSPLHDDAVQLVLDFLGDARSVLWVARGPALAAASDGALKLQETAGCRSFAYSAAELLHGPIGSLDQSDRVIGFEDADGLEDSLEAVDDRLAERGIPFLCLGQCPGMELHGTVAPLLRPTERWARTPVFAVLAQKVAFEMALHAGRNPDGPPGLQKVTRTL